MSLGGRTFNFHIKEEKQLALGISWGWSTQEVMTSSAANGKTLSGVPGCSFLTERGPRTAGGPHSLSHSLFLTGRKHQAQDSETEIDSREQ